MGSNPLLDQYLNRSRNRRRPSLLSSSRPSIEEQAAAELASDYGSAAAPAPSPQPQRSAIGTAWDTLTSPIKAVSGLDQTALVHLLGIRALAPEQYRAAREELTQGITGGEDRELGPLESAEALPGIGDVAAQFVPTSIRESLLGRAVGPVARMAGNILGSPTTYTGVGALTKVGRAADALGVAQKGLKAADLAGDVGRAGELATQIPGLAGRLAQAAGSESAVARGARLLSERLSPVASPGATGRALRSTLTAPDFTSAVRGAGRLGLSLPFGPVAGLAYAPELVEGVVGQVGETFEEARAGRYAEAAASGVGAVLSAGLGRLVAKGVISEVQAARSLERAISQQLGEQKGVETAPQPRPGAGAEEPPPPSPGVGPDAPPEVPPVPAQALTPSPSPQVESPIITPTPGSERIRINPNVDAVTRLMEERATSGKSLTKADLVSAGLVTPKQAKSYSLEALLDAHGATQLRGRLEHVPGTGYRVRMGDGGAGASAHLPAEGPGIPASEVSTPAPPTSIVPPSVTAVQAPAPRAVPIPRSEIDRQIADVSGFRELLDETVAEIEQSTGKRAADLTPEDVRAAFPGDENKATRAALNRVVAAVRKRDAVSSPRIDAALNIQNLDELQRAREELDLVRGISAEAPDQAADLGPRDVELQEGIEDALRRGVQLPPIPTPTRPPAPPKPGEFRGTVEPPVPQPREPVIAGEPVPDPSIAPRPPASPVEASLSAVDRLVEEARIPPDEFTRRASRLLSKPLDSATADELNAVLARAEKDPQSFGAPPPDLDPATTTLATRRLTGGTEHLAVSDRPRGKGFTYAPDSPAGRAQELARIYEARYGIPAEQKLQDTITRWITRLSQDDEAILRRADSRNEALIEEVRKLIPERQARIAELAAAGKTAEASTLRIQTAGDVQSIASQAERVKARADRSYRSALKIRRLLTSDPSDPAPSVELERMLRTSLTNDMRERLTPAQVSETGAVVRMAGESRRSVPIPDVMDGLSPEERKRFAVQMEEEAVEAADPRIDFPPKPADVPGLDWRKAVRSDHAKLTAYADSLIAIRREWETGKKRGGAAGRSAAYMPALKQMASDLGLTISSKRDAGQYIEMIARALGPESRKAPRPSAASPLLTDQLVASRGQLWQDAIGRGTPVSGSGSHVVVDLEGDVPPTLVASLAADAAPITSILDRLTAEAASTLSYPSRFAGLTPSPQLQGLRIGDDIYLNPLHAWHQAGRDTSGSTLTGQALTDARAYRAAQHLVDVQIHELAHKKARHDAAASDVPFTDAYASAIRSLGPRYEGMIREVRDSISPVSSRLDALTPDYAASLDALKESRGTSLEGSRPRPGPVSTPTILDRPGGAEGSPADRASARVRPAVDLPGGTGDEAGGVRDPAADLEAPPPVAPGGGGGGRPGGEPSAALTADVVAAVRANRVADVQREIESRFANNYARFAGKPEDVARLEADIRTALSDPANFEKLLSAKPGGDKDVGWNLRRIPPDAMSDEQKAGLAVALAARNATYDRAVPMTYDKINADARAQLGLHTPEEFIDFKRRTGLRTPADFALMDSIAATFGTDIDTHRANLRALDIQQANAKRQGLPTEKLDKEIERTTQDLAHSVVRRDSAIDVVVNDVTQVARILGFRRSMVHPLTGEETFKSRFLGAMRSSRIPSDKADGLYSMLEETIKKGGAGDWNAFTIAFRQATKAKTFDKFIEFWKAGLLGWPTQIANVSSNALFAGLRTLENGVSILADQAFSGLAGHQKKRYVGELAARMHGMKHGFAAAFGSLRDDLSAIATLSPPDIQSRIDRGTFLDEPDIRTLQGAIPGRTGEFIRTPFKLLDAFDNFFKHLSREQEFSAGAYRLASSSESRAKLVGGPDVPVDRAYATILEEMRRASSNPVANFKLYKKYESTIKAANDTARADTFQAPLNATMKKLYEGTQSHPALQLLFPFVKTPYNVMAEGLKRTPLGAMWAIKQFAAGKIDDQRFVDSMVKSALGSAAMGLIAQMSLDGEVTGGGPADPKQAELLKRTGWQPYSVKIGDQYISYSRMEPFATVMGLGADLAEAWKRKDVDTGAELLQKGVASISELIGNKSMLQGLDALTKIASDPQKQGLSAMRQLQASLVPNVVGVLPVAHLARGLDPNYRETEAFTLSPFQASLPGLSERLPAQRIPTGEERVRKGTTLERILSPFQRSQEETGPVAEAAQEIVRLGVSVEAPGQFFRLGEDRVYYTPEEREEIAQAQEKAMSRIGSIISRPDYQRLPDTKSIDEPPGVRTKRDVIMSLITKYRGPTAKRINAQAARRARMET